MSGIAGIIHFDGAPVEPGLIETMTAAMAYRGPDGIQHRVRGNIALGQCMLRTTPESLEEQQPLANEDESLVLVMDGRIDNWQELRRELLGKGARLRNRSDAELVLRAYETWGDGCLEHIDGDFALVIWDAHRRSAFCARDRVGCRPFNYHWSGSVLAFASEVSAILALPWVKREFNDGMVADFLGNEWHSRDETFWNHVTRLPAAHVLEADTAGIRIEQYWKPDPFLALPLTRNEEWVEYYVGLLSDIVRKMSRSHDPVACEMSGGLDSSAIFGVAEKLRQSARLLAPETLAYTLDFTGDEDADEMEYARAVGEHLGVPIHAIEPAYRPVRWYRALAAESGEFPSYPNGTMALGLREAARGRGCRVLLAGEGGDEWLGLNVPGYYYSEELKRGKWRTALACLRQDAAILGAGPTASWFIRSGVVPLVPARLKRAVARLRRRGRPRESWLSPALQLVLDARRLADGPPVPANVTRRSQRAQLEVLYGAYGALALEMEERSLARQGLERRLPLYSARIIQFALSTPERLRSLGRSTKYLHRCAMRGTLPEPVVRRTTKADFMVTFRTQLEEVENEIVQQIAHRRANWVRPQAAAALVKNRRDPLLSGWAEWPLWSLVGCDALV